MTRSDHYKTNKRVRACRFCRARLADGPRGSAPLASGDSDGKSGMLDE